MRDRFVVAPSEQTAHLRECQAHLGTSRYIATCLGTDMARLRLTHQVLYTQAEMDGNSDRMRCESIVSLATLAPDCSTGISPLPKGVGPIIWPRPYRD